MSDGPTVRPVAVLFCRWDSIYRGIAGCDVYNKARDARTWPGGIPAIMHPPCRTWGSLKAFARAPPDEHDLALWAVHQIRLFGGVIEHPAASSLWREAKLPRPGDLPDEWGGWTLEVDQFHWGHLARKRTRLYIVGVHPRDIPPIPHRTGRPTHVISGLSRAGRTGADRRALPTWKPPVSRNGRDRTPPAFAAWLVELARRSHAPNPWTPTNTR